jgi:methylaspartate ammonia-lyase
MKVKLSDFKRDIESAQAKYLEKIKITQAETAKADKQIRLVAKAMELAAKWGIKAETNAELIAMVTEKEIEHYRKAMEGEVIDIKCCDYCNSWTVGENRCFCRNRRMYLTIDGNIVDGFYHYPEAD